MAEISIEGMLGIFGAAAIGVGIVIKAMIEAFSKWSSARLDANLKSRTAEEQLLRDTLDEREKQYRRRETESDAMWKRRFDDLQNQLNDQLNGQKEMMDEHLKCVKDRATDQGRLLAMEEQIKHLTKEIAELKGI